MIPMDNPAIKPLKLNCRGMLALEDELRYDVLIIIQASVHTLVLLILHPLMFER